MKYYYQKPDICVRVFGEPIDLNHPVYRGGTLYLEHGRGIIVTQKKFDTKRKECSWDAVDSWIANDIYTSPNFAEFLSRMRRKKTIRYLNSEKLCGRYE